ncbi:MAG: DUF1553 domain-containing protein [Planctomycetota bacterium]|nr:DUF1553 domain-containing protein [Planctomycetota bacterium]
MTSIHSLLTALILAALLSIHDTKVNAAEGPTTLQVLPRSIHLQGQDARQRVLAEWMDGRRAVGNASDATWTTDNPSVATYRDGFVIPLSEGRTTLHAQSGDLHATAEIVVQQPNAPMDWEFRRHVLPVLARAGCNQGACHGALAGKGGFRLSLRGYDPFRDYFNITEESRGRRIEPSAPGRSLLLSKPTGAVPHQGGLRLDVESRDYKILANWIIAGATPPETTDPQLTRLEVLPELAQLSVGSTQPLLVQAHYSDGRVEDVTHWAKYTSTQESVAQVDANGQVRVIGHGEGAISVWFSSQIVVSHITSAYPHEVPQETYTQSPRANFIDSLVLKKLQELCLAPSARANDATYLRRVYIDTVGRLPTEQEVTAFLQDRSVDQRTQLVDRLLASPEYVDYWTYRWSDLLVINGHRIEQSGVKAYYLWLRQHVAHNTPWNQIVEQIVTARGDSVDQGSTNFYALHRTPEDMAENVSQAFLGLSINCAKCHNHPLEKWTNDQYYAMANLFARVRAKSSFRSPLSGDGLTISVEDRGDLIQPLLGKPQVPSPLDGKPLPINDPSDRRTALAAWLTSDDNPYFARAITNRIWANFMGTGLVEPVDDLRISNPASNEELLSALSNYLISHDFDVKALMRLILQSETYQRSSVANPANASDRRFYARYYPRRMMAEVLLDAVNQITEIPDEFTMIGDMGMDTVTTAEYAKGTKALQLYDAAIYSPFLTMFGRNPRDIVCECERSNTPSMVQVLHIHNGNTINQRLHADRGWISEVVQSTLSRMQIVPQAYLRVLARNPSPSELAIWSDEIARSEDVPRRELIEDIYWSLMSSREFLFQH